MVKLSVLAAIDINQTIPKQVSSGKRDWHPSYVDKYDNFGGRRPLVETAANVSFVDISFTAIECSKVNLGYAIPSNAGFRARALALAAVYEFNSSWFHVTLYLRHSLGLNGQTGC